MVPDVPDKRLPYRTYIFVYTIELGLSHDCRAPLRRATTLPALCPLPYAGRHSVNMYTYYVYIACPVRAALSITLDPAAIALSCSRFSAPLLLHKRLHPACV